MNVDLTKMNLEDLLDLNKQVVARIKILNSVKQVETLLTFNVGDSVSFLNTKIGKKVVGTVKSLGRKNVKVLVNDPFPTLWTVTPSLLTKE